MDTILLWTRLALASVFAISGIAKLQDTRGFRSALPQFGVSPTAAISLSFAIPLFEIATAALLVPGRTAVAAGMFALFLLFTFSTAVVVAWSRGRQVACACFGPLSGARIGPATLVRNAMITAGAALVAISGWRNGAGSIPGITRRTAGLLILMAAAGVVLLLIRARRLRQSRHLRRSDAPPGARTPVTNAIEHVAAPPFGLRSMSGDLVTLESLLFKRLPVLLVFVSPECRRCRQLQPQLRGLHVRHRDEVITVFVTQGNDAANVQLAEVFGPDNVLLQQEREVVRAYHVGRMPSVALIGADGVLFALSDVASVEDFLTTGAVRTALTSTSERKGASDDAVVDKRPASA